MKITPGTKRFFIAELCNRGLTEAEVYSELRPKVAEQVKPWVFTRNPDKGAGESERMPKAMGEQFVELRHEISRVFAAIGREGSPRQAQEIEPKPEPPRAKGKRNGDDEKRFFISEWKRLRRWISEQATRTGAQPIDSLDTMRPVQAARVLIDSGISARTLLGSMCLHWPKASRDMAGIPEPDYLAESESLGEGFHKLAGYVLKLAQGARGSDFGIMLIGPAGTGKSRLAKQVASLIRTEDHPDGLPYGEAPLTPGATRGDLLGRHTISGFIPSDFVEIYSKGGVFNFEEIDAADPSMLLVVNNAIASGELHNSANGEVYKKHPDFIAVSTANTFGLGSDSKYTGREKLDLATIDRFRMCRVLLSLDENLAEHLMFG